MTTKTSLALRVILPLLCLFNFINTGNPAGMSMQMAATIAITSLLAIYLTEKNSLTPKIFLNQIALIVAYLIIFTAITSCVSDQQYSASAIARNIAFPIVIKLAAYALCVGVFEEYIFRKVIIIRVGEHIGYFFSSVLSSIIFFAIHLTGKFFMFFTAMAYCIIAIRCRSIIALICLHAFYDFIGFLSLRNEISRFQQFGEFTYSHTLQAVNALTDTAFSLSILCAFLMFKLPAGLRRLANFSRRKTDIASKPQRS